MCFCWVIFVFCTMVNHHHGVISLQGFAIVTMHEMFYGFCCGKSPFFTTTWENMFWIFFHPHGSKANLSLLGCPAGFVIVTIVIVSWWLFHLFRGQLTTYKNIGVINNPLILSAMEFTFGPQSLEKYRF